MIKRNKSLLTDLFFLFFIICGVLFSSLSAYLIFKNNDLLVGFCWTPICTKNFFNLFDLPIKLLAAFGTIAGLYAVAFRSHQTAGHIAEITRQNNFSNYIEHKKEFMRLLESIEKNFEGMQIINKEFLYLSFFPDNTPQQEIQFQSKKFQNIVNHFNNSMSLFKKTKPGVKDKLFKLDLPISELLYAYHDLHIKCVDEFPSNEADSVSGEKGVMIPKARIQEVRSIIMLLGRFCLPVTWRKNTCELVVDYKEEFDNDTQKTTDNPIYGCRFKPGHPLK